LLRHVSASVLGHLQGARKFFDMCGVHKLLMSKLPEDVQELRPKHVGAIINKQKHCATSWCEILYTQPNSLEILLFKFTA